MYEKISTAEMSHREWLQIRKSGIGGSDAGAVLGVHPFCSPMKVFLDKTKDSIEEQDNEAIRQGQDLENYVAKRFMEMTKKKVRRSNFMYRSKEYPFMIADVDRLVVGEDAGLECKTANAYQTDQWKDGNIPLHYILQCYHYMAITGKKTWYLAVVILGKEFTYRKLIWDENLIKELIQTEEMFWKNYILQGIIPPPDGSKICNEILEQYFHTIKKKSAIKLIGFDEKLNRREEILNHISNLQEEQRQIEQEVKLFMKEHELASSEKYQVSWSNIDTIRLDTKRIKQEQPKIYQDYAKVSSSRRFQVRTA